MPQDLAFLDTFFEPFLLAVDRFFTCLNFLLVVEPSPGRVMVTKFSPTELIVYTPFSGLSSSPDV